MASMPAERGEQAVMARIAALLLVAGGALGVVTVLVPHSSEIDEGMYLMLAGLGFACAGAVWTLRRWVPAWGYQCVSAYGIALVGLSVYFSGDHAGAPIENELLLLWPILYAGYFFSRRAIAIQLGLAGLAYGAALVALEVGDQGIGRWIGAMGTLVAAAVFVRYLKERNDRNLSLQEATIESTTDGILVVDAEGAWE